MLIFHIFSPFFIHPFKLQCQITTTPPHQRIQFSSSATPKPKNRHDDDTSRISADHNDIKVTNISLQNIQPELDRLKQLQEQNEAIAKATATTTHIDPASQKALKKTEELPWRITPVDDFNKLMSHYLMLSKFRLTCRFFAQSNIIDRYRNFSSKFPYQF